MYPLNARSALRVVKQKAVQSLEMKGFYLSSTKVPLSIQRFRNERILLIFNQSTIEHPKV
jgi:hypothetical protein